jgi:hypothetical protein
MGFFIEGFSTSGSIYKNKRIMEEHSRQCPSCDIKITYSNKYTLKTATIKNTICKKCALLNHNKQMGEEQRLGLRENGFKGKKHSDETRSKLSESKLGKKLTEAHKQSISKGLLEKEGEHYMGKGGLYGIWLEKYSKEVADQKLIDFKFKLSKATSGSNNPMFGKPAPKGSGNGWKGWYKGFYFRSLLELSFLVNYIDRFKMQFESGEKAKWAITYTKWDGSIGTYFPDYIIEGKYMVEIKPKALINSPLVKVKTEAAIDFCNKNNLKYKIIEPVKIDKQILLDLYNKKDLVFNERLESKYINYLNNNI